MVTSIVISHPGSRARKLDREGGGGETTGVNGREGMGVYREGGVKGLGAMELGSLVPGVLRLSVGAGGLVSRVPWAEEETARAGGEGGGGMRDEGDASQFHLHPPVGDAMILMNKVFSGRVDRVMKYHGLVEYLVTNNPISTGDLCLHRCIDGCFGLCTPLVLVQSTYVVRVTW